MCWWWAPARPACRRRAARWRWAGADVIVGRRAAASRRAIFQAAGAPRTRPIRRPSTGSFRDGAILRQSALLAGVRILSEDHGCGRPFFTARGRCHRRRPFDAVPAEAPGAGDRRPTSSRLPVPGWTLPGVLTVGGLQTLARSYRVAPGQRIVGRRQRPALPADRRRTVGRRRQCRRRPRSRQPSRPRPLGAISWPPLRLSPACCSKAWGLAHRLRGLLHWDRTVDAPGGRRARATGRGGRIGRSTADIVALGYGFCLLVGAGRARWAAPIASCRGGQRLDGNADRQPGPHQPGRGPSPLATARASAAPRPRGRQGCRRRGGDRGRSRPEGAANHGRTPAHWAAPRASRRCCGGCSRRRPSILVQSTTVPSSAAARR